MESVIFVLLGNRWKTVCDTESKCEKNKTRQINMWHVKMSKYE